MNQVKRVRKKKDNTRIVSNKLGVFYLIILLAFVGLSIRLILISVDNKNEYQQKILSQQTYDSKTLNARRGEIVDCNGTVLATSREAYNVVLDVKVLLAKCENDGTSYPRSVTVDELYNVFGINKDAVNKYIDEVPTSQYFVVKKNVPYEDVVRFKSMTTKPESGKESESLYNENITGVWFEKYYVRFYPQSTLACDLIGFYRSSGEALYGLEQYYDETLTGTSGRQYGYLNDTSNLEITTIPAVDGNTIVSTIDANIQNIVEKNLKNFALQYEDNHRDGLGAANIGCIIMRADNAEVLAMASYPNFDLNNPMDLSAAYSDEQLAVMEDMGTLSAAYDGVWKNYCISDTYEPGSVMKPFTVAMGLESGTVTGREVYECNGSLHVNKYDIFCHVRTGHGTVNVKRAVADSCNVALMYMGKQIGKENFLKYQSIFNLGLKTNIDLAGESRTDALVFNEKTLNDSELATATFGQGFNVTMIQMAAGYAALVNGGYYYEPHVVSQIVSSSGSVVKNIEPRLIKQIVSNSTSETILGYCNAVVTEGSGWRARPAGYMIGGKTGTAETLPRGTEDYVVSFICHAPSENPEIICYVVIDRPNVAKQEDSKYACIVTKGILSEVLPYLGIPMTEEISETEKQELLNLELSIYTNRLDLEEDDTTGETGE